MVCGKGVDPANRSSEDGDTSDDLLVAQRLHGLHQRPLYSRHATGFDAIETAVNGGKLLASYEPAGLERNS